MADARTQHFIDVVKNSTFPSSDAITDESKRRFDEAMEILHTYRGDPKVLLQAWEEYKQVGSRPLVYAGAAHILLRISFLHSDVYDMDGVREATRWFEKAREIAPDYDDIETIQFQIYRIQKDLDNMRAFLDKMEQTPDAKGKYAHAMQEMSYWNMKGDIQQQDYWAQEALAQATNDKDKLYTLHSFGDSMLTNGQYPKAIAAYAQVEQYTTGDPWLLHNMSIALLHVNDIDRAEAYNRRALAIRDFGAARGIQATIRKLRKQHNLPSPFGDEPTPFHDKLIFHLILFTIFAGGWLLFREMLHETEFGLFSSDLISADLAFLIGATIFGATSLMKIFKRMKSR